MSDDQPRPADGSTATKPAAEPPADPTGAPDASPTSSLTLAPPEPVPTVEGPRAESSVPVDPADVAKIDGMVGAYLDAVTGLDPHDRSFAARAEDIRTLGDDQVRASASVSNRLLDKPVMSPKTRGFGPASEVSKALQELRRTVEDLDPSKDGDLLSPRRLLGVIPFRRRLKDYFQRYQSSQGHIDAIIQALYHGQDELAKDNADLDTERQNLWTAIGRLRQYVYLAERLDAGLSERIAAIESTDPERAKALKDDLLFPVRQKRQDLLTQLAVSVQGYLAMDVVRRSNVELIKGVDRATTTTVSALRTAVIVAQALADQRLVLDQISALNDTTGRMIESTSVMLRQQSGEVMQQAASSTVELEQLQKAFDNIYATMDEIDAFKAKALDSMARTIDTLSASLDKSRDALERSRDRDAHDKTEGGLKL
jgi:uncharacterized protein YaaN involved in tellurite resistance